MGTLSMAETPRMKTGADSLFRAAAQLERAVAAPYDRLSKARVRAAIRACIIAVETRLDAILTSDGLAHDIAVREPRLLTELERLENQLAHYLIELWEFGVADRPNLAARLGTLAADLRSVAGLEFDLVHDVLEGPSSQD